MYHKVESDGIVWSSGLDVSLVVLGNGYTTYNNHHRSFKIGYSNMTVWNVLEQWLHVPDMLG